MEKIVICFLRIEKLNFCVSSKRETPSDVISPKPSSLISLIIGKYGQCMQSSLCGLGTRNIFGTGRDEEAIGKIGAGERLRGRLWEDNFHLNRTEYYFRRRKPEFFFFFFNEAKFVFVDGTLKLFFLVYMDKKIIFTWKDYLHKKIIFTLTESNVIKKRQAWAFWFFVFNKTKFVFMLM